MEHKPWKLPHGTYSMKGTSRNLHHGSYLMELAPWALPYGAYIMEVI